MSCECQGPCYLPGWECPQGTLPCYKDCCKRDEYFCNNNPGQKRCQKCHDVKTLCGNSSMPYGCDRFCDNYLSGSSDKTGVYMYITIGLGVGFGLALVVILLQCIYIMRNRKNPSTPSATTSSSQLSEKVSLISTISDSSKEEELQSGDTTPDTPHTLAPLPPHTPPHHPTTPHLGQLASWAAEIPPPPPPSGQSDTMLLTRETAQPFGYNVHPAPPPLPPNPPGHPPGHRQVCRDPRLDNVRPSAEADHEVYVLTNVSRYQADQGGYTNG